MLRVSILLLILSPFLLTDALPRSKDAMKGKIHKGDQDQQDDQQRQQQGGSFGGGGMRQGLFHQQFGVSDSQNASSGAAPIFRALPFPAPGPPPDYLHEASHRAQREHFQLVMQDEKGEMPKGELKRQFAKWAEANGMKEDYEMYLAEEEQKKKAFQKLMTSNLGGTALKAFNKIWEITHNDALTRNEECVQLQDVLDSLKWHVRALVPLMPSGVGRALMPPAPGCFPEQPRPESRPEEEPREQSGTRTRGRADEEKEEEE